MENRFTLKDGLVILLLAGILVSIWLAMLQYDRQWKHVKQLVESVNMLTTEQARMNRELGQLNAQIEQGVTVSSADGQGSTQSNSTEYLDAFTGIKEAQQNPDYALGDSLIEAFGVAPEKLTPLLSGDIYAAIMQARALEPLALQDIETLEYAPLLATSWEEDPENLTIRFKLRRGVTFSDGVEMTADDVVFTFNWIMNPAVAAPRERAYFSKIESVSKIGPYEVEFKFKEPYFEWFALAASMSVLPEHFYGALTPEEFNKQPGMLMGTGPYRMTDPKGWRPGEALVLVRNERYWGEPGPFDRLMYRVIPQPANELTAYRNRDIDVLGAEPEQYIKLIEDKQFMAGSQSFELDNLRQGYNYIAWNQKRGGKSTIFADKLVRQAMTMLINRQRICDDVYLGYARPTPGPFHRLNPQANPEIEPWPYDPQRAIAQLQSAGFTRNADGVMLKPDGTPFVIKLGYVSGNEVTQRIVLMIKDDFARAGIQLNPDPLKWPSLIKALETRDFDSLMLGWSSGVESDIYQMFHSSQIEDNGDNYMHYVNSELDKVLEEARSELDRDTRMTLWHRAHAILHEDQPYTFMIRRKGLMFIDKRIKNIEPTDLGLNYISIWSMPIPWYVPQDLQMKRTGS